MSGQILSPLARYLQIQVTITLGIITLSPQIFDITVNWIGGAGSKKYGGAAVFAFSFDSTLLDVQQEYADNLGGDSAIINDAIVQAQPLILTGTTSDTIFLVALAEPWHSQYFRLSVPLTATAATAITISPYISGGMDISFMGGANPAAAVVTFAGGAAGSWMFTKINPTLPVIQITFSSPGQINDLRIVGLAFSNANYLQAQEVIDTQSLALYGDRQISISNPWIVTNSVALAIATSQVANQKLPVSYIPKCMVRPTFNAQIGDRLTIVDDNLDLMDDYIVVGLAHNFSVEDKKADVNTEFVLLKVPVGL